jgi:hypothetical protein
MNLPKTHEGRSNHKLNNFLLTIKHPIKLTITNQFSPSLTEKRKIENKNEIIELSEEKSRSFEPT